MSTTTEATIAALEAELAELNAAITGSLAGGEEEQVDNTRIRRTPSASLIKRRVEVRTELSTLKALLNNGRMLRLYR